MSNPTHPRFFLFSKISTLYPYWLYLKEYSPTSSIHLHRASKTLDIAIFFLIYYSLYWKRFHICYELQRVITETKKLFLKDERLPE